MPRPRSSWRAPTRIAGSLALTFMTALAASGCSSSSGAESTGPKPTASATSTTADTACTPSAAYTPGTNKHQLPVAGATREFLVHLPPQPVAKRVPLVVDFHGAGSDMTQQDVY